MQNPAEEIHLLSKHTANSILHDPEKTAHAAHLIYVCDKHPGITRIKKGRTFKYFFDNKEIKDKEKLNRIKGLVIPPAWQNVWICPMPNGHLQATGTDIKKRKQYKYHTLWNSVRNQTKFYRLHDFGQALPKMREQIEKDLAIAGLPLEKVLATIVSLMEHTSIRIGNNFYEKLYGSFGLTTLKNKHVVISGNKLRFSFKGKKGIEHNISLQDKKLSTIVKKCRDIPGKDLFQYYNDDGTHRTIDSGMVNEYIRKISGGDFTAKDFRTWAGSVYALVALKDLGTFESITEAKKKVAEALDTVSHHLGNTSTVCRKYYVHPLLLDLYEKKEMDKYLDQTSEITGKNGLTAEENLLLKILSQNNKS